MNREAKDRLVLLALLAAFFMTFADVRHLHRILLIEGKEWRAWIPIVMSGVLMLCCLLGMAKDRMMRNFAAGGFALGMIVGLVGLWIHTGQDLSNLKVYLTYSKDTPWEPRPYLAPLSFTGLSVIGLIVTAAGKKR